MECPSCDVDLDERFRHGIEVDVCPRCKGIWLDRGELDRLLARDETTNTDGDDVSGDITPGDLALLSKPAGDNRDDQAEGDEHENRRNQDDRKRSDERRENRDRDDRSDGEKNRSKKRKKSRTKRLGDLLEDVLDEVFD